MISLFHRNLVICLPQIGVHLITDFLHNDRHLFADGIVTVRLIAMKFECDKEKVSCLKFKKFHLNPTNFNRKLTIIIQTWFEKHYACRIQNPGAERVNTKTQYILHRKWTLAWILCTHQKSYNLAEGITLIFVSEKKSAITFGEGCIPALVILHVSGATLESE